MTAPASGTRARAVLWTVATRVLALAVNAVSGIVLARALQPDGRGEYAVVVAVASTAVSVGHLSIEQAHMSLWGGGRRRTALASNSMVLGIVVGSGGALVAAAVVALGGGTLLPGTDRAALAIILLAVPFNVTSLYFNSLTALDDRIRRVNAGAIVAAFAQAGGVIAIEMFADLTVRWAALWWTAAAAAPVLLVTRGFDARLASVSRDLLRRALRTGLQYHLGLAALFLLFRVDVFLLNALDDQTEVGLYAVAVLLAELINNLVATSAVEVLLPRLMDGTREEAASFTARAFRANALLILVSAVGLAALSPLLIPLLYGGSFSGSVGPLLALLPGVAALGAIRPVTTFIVRLDRPLVVSSLVWTAFSVNVGLNLALIPPLGAVGAATASSVAYVLLCSSYLVWFLRAGAVSVRDIVPRPADARGALGDLLGRRAR